MENKLCTKEVMHNECVYGTYIHFNLYYCNYIGIEKHSRGCDPKCCNKFKPKNKTK